MARKLLPADIHYLVQEYASGRSAQDIGREFGVGCAPITGRLKAAGVTIRGNRLDLPAPDVCDAYRGGASSQVIAARFGVTQKVVARILQERGISFRDRRLILPVDDVKRLFIGGVGAGGIAKRLGCSPSVVSRVLRSLGLRTRNRSEQQAARMRKATPDEIRKLTSAAHRAAKGRKKTSEELKKSARSKESSAAWCRAKTGPAERRLAAHLTSCGLNCVPQKAIGPYNCDLAIGRIAVEIWGGHWHWHGDHAARFEVRTRYLLNAGWDVLIIVVQRRGFPFTPAVGDYVAACIDEMGSDPSSIRQYRVVWGAGEFSTGGRADDNEISCEPPFGSARDTRTGQYKSVPR